MVAVAACMTSMFASCCLRGRRAFSRLTLHFDSADMEIAFVQQRKGALISSGAALSLIGALMDLAVLLHRYIVDAEFLQNHLSTEVAGLGLRVHLLAQAGVFIVFAAYVLFLRSSLVDRVGAVQLEVFSAALITVAMVVIVSCSHVNVTRMMGYGNEVYQGFACTSDSVPLLAIDGLITASHVGLPVRWRVLLPMEVIGVLLYAFIVFVRGSCEQSGSFYNLVWLTLLVMASAVGKRTTESWERECFKTVIGERRQRCEAEFQLSQAEDEQRGNAAVDHQDREEREERASSLPTQTPSMHVFDAVRDGVEGAAMRLARIAELGRAEHWFIHPEEVDILHDERLGQGSFGTVFKGIFCGMVIAVKQPRHDMQNMNLTSLCNELCILRRLRHPNIIATFGAIVDAENAQVTLVLEFLEGATLHTFILKTSQSDGCQDARPYVRFKLMLGVSHALKYMHSRDPQIVHGDLKSINIMVEGSGNDANAKLLDFGLSRVRVRGTRALGGTLAWMAPEVALCIGKVKCSADIFSYGRLLTFIASSILPLAGLHAHSVRRMMSRGVLPRLDWPDGCVFEPFCKKLVETCLVFNEAARPSISRVHGELLGLPGKMDLGGTGTTFLRNVEAVAIKQRIAMGDDGSLLADLPPRPTDTVLNTAPSVPEDKPLPAEVSGQIQSAFQPIIPLLFPGMLPTDTEVMVASLCKVIARWNFTVANGFCCPIHAGAKMASQMCNALLDQPCTTQEFTSDLGEQCGRCGMLGLPDKAVGGCDVCRDLVLPLQSTTAAGGQTTCISL